MTLNPVTCVQACTNQVELTQVLNDARALSRLQLLEKPQQCVGVMHHFTKCYNDALCMSSFAHWAKSCRYSTHA